MAKLICDEQLAGKLTLKAIINALENKGVKLPNELTVEELQPIAEEHGRYKNGRWLATLEEKIAVSR